tara:strand:- start:329 stop:556 length:228 start_codon:yes stop_codon:yes gene_type:complete
MKKIFLLIPCILCSHSSIASSLEEDRETRKRIEINQMIYDEAIKCAYVPDYSNYKEFQQNTIRFIGPSGKIVYGE